MNLKDKIAKDKDRDWNVDLNKVYLFREGTFFRAFNFSAWLISEVIYTESYREKIGAKEALKVLIGKN